MRSGTVQLGLRGVHMHNLLQAGKLAGGQARAWAVAIMPGGCSLAKVQHGAAVRLANRYIDPCRPPV